jgi:plastocyanin
VAATPATAAETTTNPSTEKRRKTMLRLTIGLATVVLAAMTAVSALAAPAAQSAQTIRVTEREYSISLSARPKAGKVTFVVHNSGDDTHNFFLRGGGKTYKSRTLGEAATAKLVATLKKGVKYQYWCAVSDHASEGMRGSFVAR